MVQYIYFQQITTFSMKVNFGLSKRHIKKLRQIISLQMTTYMFTALHMHIVTVKGNIQNEVTVWVIVLSVCYVCWILSTF